jgi:hypothetical protein
MCPDMLYKIKFVKKEITLSNSIKNIKAREERKRIKEWKKKYGPESIPPKKPGRILSMNSKAIKAREKRLLLRNLMKKK